LIEEFEKTIPKKELKSFAEESFFRRLNSFLALIPNSIYLDFSSSDLKLNSPIATAQTFESNLLIQILGSFSIRNTRSPKTNAYHGYFRFTGGINFAYENIRLHPITTSPLSSSSRPEIQWIEGGLGVGPEVGLETPLGYAYLNLTPALTLNHFWTKTQGRWGASVEINTELGYSLVVGDRIALRFYIRHLTLPDSPWRDFVSEVLQSPSQLSSSAYWVGGFAFGYYFPEVRHQLKQNFLN
jgi:hypothetical protein